MARKPAPESTRKQKASPADQAYGAAASFIDNLGTLAWHARQLTDPNRIKPSADDPEQWKPLGATYAPAFIAWFDLSHLLTLAVRDAARRVYPPGAPAIKLGKLKATPTVIEAIADELGVFFRNVLYQDRKHPLDLDTERVAREAKERAAARQVAQGKPATPLGWGADFDELMKHETRAAVRERNGIKTLGDGWMLFAREWENQDPARVRSRLELLRCGSIDFDDLKTQLDREARAVVAAVNGTTARTITVPAETLARLEAAAGTVAELKDAHGKGMARVEELIASVGGQDNGAHDAGDTVPANAIDENDASILAFLNRTPNLRRKVSDVLPDKGPQDRKAVAKRLRKLADRTPALVDYPKDGRTGVAILPTGAAALKQATTPH